MDTINLIRELYQQKEAANKGERFYRWSDSLPYPHSLEHYLNELSKHPPEKFTLRDLDDYDEQNREEGFSLCIVLSHLPSKAVYSEFGSDALLWSWIRNSYRESQDAIAEGLTQILGVDVKRLEKARLTAWQLLFSRRSELVKSIYDFSDALIGGAADSIELPTLLQGHAKNGIELSDKRINDYSLEPLTTESTYSTGDEVKWGAGNNSEGNKRYIVYLDSPVGIALSYKGEPNAVLGLFPCDTDTLFITQLQGVQPYIADSKGNNVGSVHSRGLAPLNWEYTLIDIAAYLCRQLGYSRIGIQGGRNNKWTQPYGRKQEIHLPLEKALERYDKTAKRLGFCQAKDRNWYKSLN